MLKSMLTLLSLFALTVSAQPDRNTRQIVVVDFETLVPIAGVNVTSREGIQVTDSLGCFAVGDSCRTLVFSHVNYESRVVNTDEVNDTVLMVSKQLNVKEVVVFGKAKNKEDLSALQNSLRLDKTEAQLLAANPASGGNLLQLLSYVIPKKWRKESKKSHKERLKRMLEEY